MTSTNEQPILYCAVLRPYRSASPITARRVVLGTGVVWGVVGLLFASIGAWPIMPFLGLEVLILFAAFSLNNTSGQTQEAINLTASMVTVRRVDHWGKETVTQLPTNWLQVNLDNPPTPQSRLELRSHGKSLHVGSFLGPAEKADLARTLRRHLARHPGTPNDAKS